MSVRIKNTSALARLKAARNGKAKATPRVAVVEESTPSGMVSAEDDVMEDEDELEEDEWEDEDEDEDENSDESESESMDEDDDDEDDGEYEEDEEEVASTKPVSGHRVVVEPVIALVEMIAKHKDTIVAALREAAK